MKLLLKCTSSEFSPSDIAWALITIDTALQERALARRQLFRQSQAQDPDLVEMVFSDSVPDFFAICPDPNTEHYPDLNEFLEDTLRDHTGQSIAWAAEDLHRVSDETSIPDAYLRGVDYIRMHVDAHALAWTAYPKYLDTEVWTSTIPWELIEGQRLFAPPPSER